AVQELKAIAQGYDKSLPQLALRWVTQKPAISVALMGCRRPEEVEENVGALGWTISDSDLAEIDAVFERHAIETAPDEWIEDDGLSG
ncbi:MAG: aldo/keto reductase, partial [Myxococcota bacterium]